MGRRPINKSMRDLEPKLREQISEALLSAANEKVADIYRRFGLSQRGIVRDSFYDWSEGVRARGLRPSSSSQSATMDMEQQVLGLLEERTKAGDAKHLTGIAAALRALHDRRRVNMEEQAEKRAAELHESKLRKLEPALKEALAEPTTPGSKDLRSILERVANGGLSIDAATREIGDVLWVEIDKQMRGGN